MHYRLSSPIATPVGTAILAPRATPTLGTDVLANTSGRRTVAVNPLGRQLRTQTWSTPSTSTADGDEMSPRNVASSH